MNAAVMDEDPEKEDAQGMTEVLRNPYLAFRMAATLIIPTNK
jgi:hypothetical protein